MEGQEIYTRIVTALGDPEGQCYVAAEAVYHALGGKQAGYTPMVMHLPDGFELVSGWSLYGAPTHWFLRIGGFILDPTVAQFVETPDYASGRGCGFLTRKPSKRAVALLTKARITW